MISALLSKSLVMIASNPAEVIGIVESRGREGPRVRQAAHAQPPRRFRPSKNWATT